MGYTANTFLPGFWLSPKKTVEAEIVQLELTETSIIISKYLYHM